MDKLVKILKAETATLKEQYLDLNEKWALEQVVRNINRKSDFARWIVPNCRFYSYERRGVKRGALARVYCWDAKDYLEVPYKEVTENEFYKEERATYKMASYMTDEVEFPKRARKAALAHYENSINKLAARIEKKGLNINKLTTVTAHVEANIETTLTDGEQTVRAFTILAWGEINRPHYRYLVK